MRRWISTGLGVAAVISVVSPAGAQESPYTDLQARPIKALSEQQVQEYMDGKGMGFALAAELNAYPGPRHVLDMKEEIGLDAERSARVEEIFGHMQARAKRLGERIVGLERRLDRAFAERTITSSELQSMLAELGNLSGQLRFVHLDAHLQVTALLTDEEIHAYQRLRGYSDMGAAGHRHEDM